MTRGQFQDYWENKHPLSAPANAIEVLGIRKYVQVFPLSEKENSPLRAIRNGGSEFDGVAEIWIDDLETFNTKWNSGEGQKAFKAFLEDEKNFVDWERSVFFIGEEKTVF